MSVVQPVIESTFYCTVCRLDYPLSQGVALTCNHIICRDCAQGEIEYKLSEAVSILRCSQPTCGGTMNQRIVRELCSPELYMRYIELAGLHAIAKRVNAGETIL